MLARIHLDLPLLTGIVLLVGFGLVILYSATGQNLWQVEKQAIRLGIALVVMLVLAQIHPNTLRRWSPWLYLAGMALLAAVLIVGETGKGAQRWLDLGFMRFQPSELVKLAVPMIVALLMPVKRSQALFQWVTVRVSSIT